MWGKPDLANNRFLVRFEKEAEDFIDAAGLNNDANLNVGGLYNAAQARFAVNQYVVLLKSTYVDGTTTRVWDVIDAFFPATGGTVDTVKLNLKNPANSDSAGRLIFLNRTLVDVPSIADADTLLTGKGISGFAKIGNLLLDNSYLSNITLYSYISAFTSGGNGSLIAGGGSLGEVNGASPQLSFNNSINTSFGFLGNFISSNYIGGLGYSTNVLSGTSIPAGVLNNIRATHQFGGTNMSPNGRQLRINHSSANTTSSVYLRISVQAQNSIMLGKYIGNQALQKINHGINWINRSLNRAI